VQAPDVFAELLKRVGPHRVVVAVDVKEGRVAARGWTTTVVEPPVELARRLRSHGILRLLVTDVSRDGMLTGPNVDLTRSVAREGGIPVIASGGVSGSEDLRSLQAVEKDGIEAVIVGKALYEGRIRLDDVKDLL
jgi:phosphoribosylformimino-5-aminoimidazole carboxamide ribotide isomerase